MNQSAASKMASIHRAKVRHERTVSRDGNGNTNIPRYSWQDQRRDKPLPPVSNNAIELPGDDSFYQTQSFRPGAQHYEHRPSIADQKYIVEDGHDAPYPTHHTPPQQPAQPASASSSPFNSPQSQTRYPGRTYLNDPYNSQRSGSSPPPRHSHDSEQRTSPPPPIPPKTPIDEHTSSEQHRSSSQDSFGPRTFMNMGDLGRRLPYPDVEGPPPAVNTANKPTISR